MTNFQELFQKGLAQLNLNISEAAQNKMLEFLHFLNKWNQYYNLTAITDLNKMISHHLLDSLSIAPYLQGNYILDVGSGAGFPGIPLAFFFPEKNFVLLDSNGKKIRFLIQAKAQFNITNITPVHARVEDFKSDRCFEAIIFRAVGAISIWIEKSQHLCCPTGKFLFMKGDYPTEELQGLQKSITTHELILPDLQVKRHLIVVSP